MDDLLRQFLAETNDRIDTVASQRVQFGQEPLNAGILGNRFRPCTRLEALTHAAETLIGECRDGSPVTGEAVTPILIAIDRIKDSPAGREAPQTAPAVAA